MPLLKLSGPDAIATRRGNLAASWGSRSEPNRVEPIARPEFDTPFRLVPGERIFTIGSCFARHIELELQARGFSLPFCDLLEKPDFAGMERGFLNNYGTPSIYNELRWALEPETDDLAAQILPFGGGKYVSLHYRMRPAPYAEVAQRIGLIRDAYRAVRDCRVLILTLGLIEVWFDTRTRTYLNLMPLPSLLKANPAQFELHVLSYEETHGFLDAAIRLLQRHCRPDLRILLTVSPVPMQATHRPADVMVANSYSKSALRTAAEEVCARYPFISYYPSYESVTLSERGRVWLDDLVHPTPEVIALNVDRMVQRFVGQAESTDEADARIAAGGALVAAEAAAKARAAGGETAAGFFSRHGAWSTVSREFALEHAAHLAETDPRAGAALLAALPEAMRDQAVSIALARLLVKAGQPDRALALLRPLAARSANAVWSAMLEAALAEEDRASALRVAAQWIKAVPSQGRMGALVAARERAARGLAEDAAALYWAAAQLNPGSEGIWTEAARATGDGRWRLGAPDAVASRSEVRQALMDHADRIAMRPPAPAEAA